MQIYRATSESFLVDSCVTFNARKGPAQEIVCFFLLNLVSRSCNVLSGTHCYDREQKRYFHEDIVSRDWIVKYKFWICYVTSQAIYLFFFHLETTIANFASVKILFVFYYTCINWTVSPFRLCFTIFRTTLTKFTYELDEKNTN